MSTFKKITLLLLLCLSSNQIFSSEEDNTIGENNTQITSVEKTKTKKSKDQKKKETLKQLYFKKFKKDFIANKLAYKPEKKAYELANLIKTGLVGVGSGVLSFPVVCFLLGGLAAIIWTNRDTDELITRLLIVIGIKTSFAIGLIAAYSYLKKSKKIFQSESLVKLISSYRTKLEKLGVNNNKNYIPENLHEIFDRIYRGYKKHGEEYILRKAQGYLKIIANKHLLNKSSLTISLARS